MTDFSQLTVSITILSGIIFCLSPLCVFADVGNDSSQTNNIQADDKLLLDKTIVKLLQEKHSYSYGEIIIASGTIFAFVGFGSFLIIKFESRSSVPYLLDLTNYSLLCVFLIEAFQTYIMISIVGGWFDIITYEILMSATAVAFGLVLFSVRLIIGQLNPVRAEQVTKVSDDWLTLFDNFLNASSTK